MLERGSTAWLGRDLRPGPASGSAGWWTTAGTVSSGEHITESKGAGERPLAWASRPSLHLKGGMVNNEELRSRGSCTRALKSACPEALTHSL